MVGDHSSCIRASRHSSQKPLSVSAFISLAPIAVHGDLPDPHLLVGAHAAIAGEVDDVADVGLIGVLGLVEDLAIRGCEPVADPIWCPFRGWPLASIISIQTGSANDPGANLS